MQVDIRDNVPELRIASVSHVGPYNTIGAAFGRLSQISGGAGLAKPGAALVGVYHDDPRQTPAEQLRSDAGIVVPEGASVPAELNESRVAGGRYAVALHEGSYETLPNTWKQLMEEWFPKSGKRPAGTSPAYEYYLNTPMDTPPDQLRTEIRIPIA